MQFGRYRQFHPAVESIIEQVFGVGVGGIKPWRCFLIMTAAQKITLILYHFGYGQGQGRSMPGMDNGLTVGFQQILGKQIDPHPKTQMGGFQVKIKTWNIPSWAGSLPRTRCPGGFCKGSCHG